MVHHGSISVIMKLVNALWDVIVECGVVAKSTLIYNVIKQKYLAYLVWVKVSDYALA